MESRDNSSYADVSAFNLRKPGFTLHEGTRNKGGIKAVCHIGHYSNVFKIDVEDPAKPDSAQ